MSRGERIADVPAAFEAIVADPEKYTLKRAAWAYGCAAKGSAIEAALLDVLITRVRSYQGASLREVRESIARGPLPVPIGKPILREDPMEAFGSGKPERFERQVMGQPICLTPGCGSPAVYQSDYCPPCRSIRSGHGL